MQGRELISVPRIPEVNKLYSNEFGSSAPVSLMHAEMAHPARFDMHFFVGCVFPLVPRQGTTRLTSINLEGTKSLSAFLPVLPNR